MPRLQPAAEVRNLASVLALLCFPPGSEEPGSSMGERSFKVGILTLLDPLDFAPRGGRDHGSEGGVEEAAVSRDLEWWVLFRRLNFFFLHASESLDDELLDS